MATEYTITYTYTGQDNTSANRSVPLSDFKKSGDTNRTIGQIKSITYAHWHTSTTPANWALRGRLVLSDGTTFISDVVEKTISGTKVQFVNTFTNLPTPEQFAMVKSVQTLNSQGTTGHGDYSATLYWRANKSNPMVLTVTFIEEPPVVYAPKIDKFELTRCNASGKADDEGQYIGTTLKLSVGNSAGLTGAQCRVYYAADAYPEVGVSQYVDLTSKISSLVSGVALNTTILTGVWSLASVWNFAVVFITGEETAIATASVARGTVNFHISGEPGGGAAVGGFSSGTTAKPKFESHVPAHFYAGIEGVTDYISGEAKTAGKWIDGKPIYRSVFDVAFNDVTDAGTYTVGTIANFETPVSIHGFYRHLTNRWVILPYTFKDNTANWATALVIDSSNKVLLQKGAYGTLSRVIIIVEYTKTTD